MTSQISTDRPELVLDITCQRGATGVMREASVETTTTGVRWTISGDLAEAIAAWNRRSAPDLPRHAGEDDLVERLRGVDNDDHERLCQGREYACTCGYDERIRQAALDAAARISSDSALLATVMRERDSWKERAADRDFEADKYSKRAWAAEAALAAARRERDEAVECIAAQNRVVTGVWDAIGGQDPTREGGQNLGARVREAIAAARQQAIEECAKVADRGGFGVRELDMFIPGWRDELSEMTRLKAALSAHEATIAELEGKLKLYREINAVAEMDLAADMQLVDDAGCIWYETADGTRYLGNDRAEAAEARNADMEKVLEFGTFSPWLRTWCKSRFGKWITYNTAKSALADLRALSPLNKEGDNG